MSRDRSETNDLADAHPDRVRKMGDMYNEWADQSYVNPPMTP